MAEYEGKERINFSVSAAIYITETGLITSPIYQKILLLQELRGDKLLWGPPGGGLKAHEDPLTAIVREVKEETDLDINITNLIGIYTCDRGDNKTGIGFVFQGIFLGKGEININKSEINDYKFFTFEEIKELLKKDLIYKPDDYNRSALNDFFAGFNKYSPLSITRSNTKKYYWF